MLAEGLACMAFIMLTCVPSIFTSLRDFNHKWVQDFVSCFLARYGYDHIIFIFRFMWCVTLIAWQGLNHPCLLAINPARSWCMMVLIYLWVCWGLLRLCSSSRLASSFLSLYCLCLEHKWKVPRHLCATALIVCDFMMSFSVLWWPIGLTPCSASTLLFWCQKRWVWLLFTFHNKSHVCPKWK